MTKALLTVEEATETLNLGRTKVYELIRSGDLESLTIGTARRIPTAAIEKFIDRHIDGRTTAARRDQKGSE